MCWTLKDASDGHGQCVGWMRLQHTKEERLHGLDAQGLKCGYRGMLTCAGGSTGFRSHSYGPAPSAGVGMGAGAGAGAGAYSTEGMSKHTMPSSGVRQPSCALLIGVLLIVQSPAGL